MSDDLNPEGNVSAAGDRFPFVMVLTTTFLLGAIFVILNGPPLILLLKGDNYSGLHSLIFTGLGPMWVKASHSTPGMFSSFLFLALSLVVGLLLTPIDRAITAVSTYIWQFRRIRRRHSSLPPFTSLAMMDPSYVAMLAWLIKRRDAKLHWEWELFNYYVYWSLFTNVLICISLLVAILWPMPPFQMVTCLGVLLLFFGFAGMRSDFMAQVHEHYRLLHAKIVKTSNRVSPNE